MADTIDARTVGASLKEITQALLESTTSPIFLGQKAHKTEASNGNYYFMYFHPHPAPTHLC